MITGDQPTTDHEPQDPSNQAYVDDLIAEFREVAYPGQSQEVVPLSLAGDGHSPIIFPTAIQGNGVLELQKVQPQSHALSPERKEELRRQGLIGVAHLRERMSTHQIENDPSRNLKAKSGIEREQSAVTADTFEPAYEAGQRIFEEAKQSSDRVLAKSVSPELGRHQIEQNTPVVYMKSGTLHAMDRYLRSYDNKLGEIAQRHGARIISTGLLPSLNETNLLQENLNPGARYNQLVAGLADAMGRNEPYFNRTISSSSGPMTTRFYADAEGQSHLLINTLEGSLHVKNVSVVLESVMTSMQVHIDVPNQHDYVGYHRACDMLTPALIATTAASPLLAGFRTGFQESRNGLLWQTSVSPWRTGFMRRDWISDPLEQFYDAQVYGPLLEPAEGGKAQIDGAEECVNVALGNAKTIWPFNRTTLSFDDDRVHARIENRVMSAGPTVTDEVAHYALAYGGTVGLHDILKESGIPIEAPYPQLLDRSIHFMHTRNNLFRACADGLEADFRWIQGKRIKASDFVTSVAVPAAVHGLAKFGIDQEEAIAYLKPVIDRANFEWKDVPNLPAGWHSKKGLTTADIVLYLDELLPKIEPECQERIFRGRRITGLLVEANEYDRRVHALTGEGAGVLGWFKDQFLSR